MKSPFTATLLGLLAATGATAQPSKPTIVLVHGAFADSSSWNGVTEILEKDGFSVVAVANPLRGVASDARYVADVVKALNTTVVLVGHSYGGSVISSSQIPTTNVAALVYVAAFAPDVGETAVGLSGKFPGSTLGAALAAPVALTGGGNDLYIQYARFHEQFAADVPASEAATMAAGQRPITEAALNEAASEPTWKSVSSWFVYGDQDKNIPPEAIAFMAERAKSRETVVVKGASHVVMVSHPETVATLIERAASTRSP
jgi:pimeloyl-ACP methyl ester carboxylesterase